MSTEPWDFPIITGWGGTETEQCGVLEVKCRKCIE